MTARKDFKKIVRTRMAETGESYMVAKRAIEQQATPRQEDVLRHGKSEKTEKAIK